MKRTTRVVVVCALVVGIFTITGCSISIGSMREGSPSRAAVALTSSAVPAPAVSPPAPAGASPSASTAGATYLAIVGPANTATFALDTAVLGSSADLTTRSLSAVIAASAASIQTLDDRLRSATWPRTAEPDVTTLAATGDVLVVVLQGYESDLQSPAPGADFSTVLHALQVVNSPYAIDRGLLSDAAGRVRADLGLPPLSAQQVTLND